MNKNSLWLSTLLAATAGIGTVHSADTQAAEKLGEHPAVIVARNWNARAVDPNTFIVAHPARLQLVAASPSQKEQKVAEATVAAGR
jgi:hypothetical protein